MDSSLKSPQKQTQNIQVPSSIKYGSRNQSTMNKKPGKSDNQLNLKVNVAANWRRRNTSSGDNFKFMHGIKQSNQLQDGESGTNNGTNLTASTPLKISPQKVKFNENPVNKTSESKIGAP